MSNSPGVPLMLTVPEKYKNMLHLIAAQRVLDNPENRSTAAGVAREVLIEYLLGIEAFHEDELSGEE